MGSPMHTTGQPMFTPVSHPVLRKLGRKTIHAFLRDRENYLLYIQDANASGSALTPVPLRSSIDRDLLLSLIAFETFEGIQEFNDLTEDILEEWLRSKEEVKLESISLEELETAIKSAVKINVHEPDAELRIRGLFSDYQTLLRHKKWERLIDDKPKLSIRHICELLKPAVLKDRIIQDIELGINNIEENWMSFFKHVLKRAIACEEYVPLKGSHSGYEKTKTTKKHSTFSQSSPNASLHMEKAVCQPATPSSVQVTPQRSSRDKNGKATTSTAPKCLNPACGEHHYIRYCTVSTPQEKAKFLKEYRDKRSEVGRLNVLNNQGDNFIGDESWLCNKKTDLPPGRYRAKLADNVPVIVNGDYGADHASISDRHLQMCAKAGIFVQVLPLAIPIAMGLALQDQDADGDTKTYLAKKKARISTTLYLGQAPLRLRNVEYLVFDEPMKEVLLSRPLLQSIGFDLDRHLSTVRNSVHDKDFSNIGFQPDFSENSKLTKLLLSDKEQQDANLPLDEAPEYSVREKHDVCAVQTKNPPVTSIDYSTTLCSSVVQPEKEDLFDKIVSVGTDDEHKTSECLDSMVQHAINNGLPPEHHDELHALVKEYADIFRTKLGADPPAKVPPMKVILKPGAVPIRVRQRRYSPLQTTFLRQKIDELLSLGLIYPNNTSQWASAPLVVPKSGTEKFRFTVDLRPVNEQTVPHVWPMPDLEAATSKLSEDVCFATLDLCQGYWQLPLDVTSQECQSFITEDGVFTPTRVMHGQTNAVSYLQSNVQLLCTSIRDRMLQWLDDMLLHCRSIEELLITLRKFFQICRRNNLKLHAQKCQLYLHTVRWCGRLISKEGVRMDPSRLNGLLELTKPSTGAELQQFVCAATWMKQTIPEFNKIMDELRITLEAVYEQAGSRTRKAVSKVSLQSIWGKKQDEALEQVKNALRNAATLAHPDPTKLLCLFTDASELHWAGILTQIPASDMDALYEDQNHEPLAFISGSFTGSSTRWSTVEKEAYAIVESVMRLDYLLLRPEGFYLFTDHKNLVFMFNPLSTNPSMGKHVLTKVERWAMRMSSFRYTIVHIPGDENCWADLLSRWGAPHSSHVSSNVYRASLSSLFIAPVAPDLDPDFTWPEIADIIAAQAAAIKEGKEHVPTTLKNGIYYHISNALWIPADATELQLRICIIAHCGSGGHRGENTTYNHIKEYFHWKGLKQDVSAFCKSCLHCISTTGGNRVPRPMGHALHSDKPNEVIHFDYLYMGPSISGEIYLLIIKDDASSFVWLEPSSAADTNTTVETLHKWFSLFGIAPNWISDRGSHFKNALMDGLNRAMHTRHHFTTAYCPQSNGTVESVCKQVLRATRSLLSEFRLSEKEWPKVSKVVQSVLNHSKRESMGGNAPITVFTGITPSHPLLSVVPKETPVQKSLEFIRAQKLIGIERLIRAIDEMHRDVSARKTKSRQAAVDAHNRKTHVLPINFEIGDYVLVAQRQINDGHKLRVKWRGPRRVTRAESDYVYELEDLITGSHALVHANRLKFYSDSSLNVSETLLDTIAHNNPHFNTVEELQDLRYNDDYGRYEVKTKWKGFDYEDPTWEPLEVLREDIPEMISAFLSQFYDQRLAKEAASF